MNIEFTPHAWDDYIYWLQADRGLADKIVDLIKSIQHDPFKGLGKPEPLRFGLKGYRSRRISVEHRLIYKVNGKKGVDQKCTIIQCRFHYD